MTKNKSLFSLVIGFALCLSLSACQDVEVPTKLISININDPDNSQTVQIEPGQTVDNILAKSGVSLNTLDRVSPPGYTVVEQQLTITITRVSESFDTEEIVIPFETQTMKNETLTEGQTLLVQSGVNGVQVNTYRIIFENGIEVSRSLFKQEMFTEPKPEIIMVGIQTPFTEIDIPGKLAYISSGNAWVMQESSGNRHPIVTSGDLDGRIFSLSIDGNWLLYTKFPEEETPEVINELWAVKIDEEESEPIYLRVNNIIHFADWVPGSNMTVAYSTVETRDTAPGWQANNDLFTIAFNLNGIILEKKELLPASSGGIYGWWGTKFLWSSDGNKIAYSRPDSIGLIDIDAEEIQPLVSIAPYQTKGNWAWIPGISWSNDGEILVYADHPSNDNGGSESSPVFSLSALVMSDVGNPIEIRHSTGMFAYPSISPQHENHYYIAYLQAMFPEISDNSDYEIFVMDQDASNAKKIFPPEGAPGIDPQAVMWNPLDETNNIQIAAIYQGNLWLIDLISGSAFQITGDASITNMDWK